MTRRISDVAVCLAKASSRSRLSRAISVSWPTAEEPRTPFGVTPLLRTAALRRCGFARSPPALERRRIATPRLRTRHRGEVRLARWSMVRHNLSGADVYVGLKTRNVSKTEQITSGLPPKSNLGGQFTR